MTGRHTFAHIDLSAIRDNIASVRGVLGENTEIAAVVKANAYGHGSVEVSRAALEAGAGTLAVAMAEEAAPLREAGITAPILVIGPSNPDQIALGVQLGLDMCVFTAESLRVLETEAARACKTGRMHVKIDTGMNRIGLQGGDELRRFLDAALKCRNVDLTGVFTHFSCADDFDRPGATYKQAELFMEAVDIVRSKGYRPLIHASNSAAAQNIPDMDLDMIRFGISMYGYPAGLGSVSRSIALRPAMQVEAEISVVRHVPAGAHIGYGGTFTTTRPSRIATTQIGYGDGYNRLLSNQGRMLVHSGGKAVYAPVVGRVCMDMTMLDVTDFPDVMAGDTAIAMGSADGLRFDARDIAEQCGTISYEILCGYTERVPRVYHSERHSTSTAARKD